MKVEHLPWAQGERRLTQAYAWFLATWAKRMSWTEVAQTFNTSWDNVFRSVEMAVKWGRKHMDLDDIKAIGVDEILWHKGHQYLTVVYQIDEHRKRLKEDTAGLETLLSALRYRRGRCGWTRKEIFSQQVGYFQTHRDHMNYVELQERNLPIGSGVVEAACKTLVTQRLKRSGMSWSQEGGQAILTLRSLLQSDRWHRGWTMLAAQFVRPVRPAA